MRFTKASFIISGMLIIMNTKKIIHLTPPKLDVANIDQNIVCIRAHRERIFNVSTEFRDNKLICHNYGQGGAGWTFLFGCVNESLRQFEHQLARNTQLKNKSICVIGAGCYGLLTAIMLARAGHAVRIVAADTHSISSYKAAGFFFPRWRKCSNEQEIAIFLARSMESYQTYLDIINGTHPFITHGPKLLPAYYGIDIDPGFGPYITHGLVEKPMPVAIQFGNTKLYNAMQYTTVFVNGGVIMQELQRNIHELGITITQQKIENFNEIDEHIIFNCAGLGAKELAHDNRLIPVQGHLISLCNQPIDQLQYMINFKVVQTDAYGTRDELIYFAPKGEGILGITFKRGESSLTANAHEFERLLERSRQFF